GRVIRSSLKKPNPQAGDEALYLTWEEIAYLAGGYPRLTTAAIARLIEGGHAHVQDNNALLPGSTTDDKQLTQVEKAVFRSLPFGNKPVDLKPVQESVEA